MNQTAAGPALDAVIEQQFPIRGQGLYVNHAAISPWPRCVAEAVSRFAAENAAEGPARYREWIEREQRLRQQLADLLNAPSADDIALLKNTTEGISAVAWGLNWNAGENVVLPAGEFASNRLPWLAQAPAGIEVHEIDIRTAGDAEGALIAAMDEQTRLLSVSAVQWSDGFRLDLARLGAACRERSVLFFVDAIQQLGALRLDVAACQIDFLAADAHKWLLGPEGIAVFFSRAAARRQLRLLQQGWHMYENPWVFRRTDWTPAESARRFEAGSPNSLGQAALSAALELLQTVGADIIEARVLSNTGRLLENLPSLPALRLVSATAPERRSGIVAFQPVAGSAARLHRALQKRGIVCAVRNQAIRLSPHFYQGTAELEQLLRGIEQEMAALRAD